VLDALLTVAARSTELLLGVPAALRGDLSGTFSGLKTMAPTMQLRSIPASIRNVPFHEYSVSSELASGAMANVPTPLPQTATPIAMDRRFWK